MDAADAGDSVLVSQCKRSLNYMTAAVKRMDLCLKMTLAAAAAANTANNKQQTVNSSHSSVQVNRLNTKTTKPTQRTCRKIRYNKFAIIKDNTVQ